MRNCHQDGTIYFCLQLVDSPRNYLGSGTANSTDVCAPAIQRALLYDQVYEHIEQYGDSQHHHHLPNRREATKLVYWHLPPNPESAFSGVPSFRIGLRTRLRCLLSLKGKPPFSDSSTTCNRQSPSNSSSRTVTQDSSVDQCHYHYG